jgi:3-phenylpropionate/trans-cinnamate dioxygenase ferredoxin subunit
MITTHKQYNWYKVAESENELPFAPNGIAVVTLNSKKICIARCQDKLFAFTYTCPHSGGILAEGCLNDRGIIVCPVHGYKFNIQNGHNTSGEGYFLKHWLVEKQEDGVYVAQEENGFDGGR